MFILVLILATLSLISWLLLLGRFSQNDLINAAYCRVFYNYSRIDELDMRLKKRLNRFEMFQNTVKPCKTLTKLTKLMKLYELYINNSTNRINKIKKEIEALLRGNLGCVNLFAMPGYVMLSNFEIFVKNQLHVEIIKRCNELYGKKHSVQKAKHLMAQLLSYTLLGISISLLIGALMLVLGNSVVGVLIPIVCLALTLVLVYAIYDELNEKVLKRRVEICKQFPNVVSKLALLVTSGMIMDRAWKLTANSSEDVLYREMRLVSDEIDNLVNPETAYNNFITRCNTKETAKLAGAIMQNLSKGNAHIGKLLQEMAREAWLERRHKAKRDAEKANSKLMIPTMMLFLAILIMLMVPIVMSFSSI